MSKWNHLNKEGNPQMVDVSDKAPTSRIAEAMSKVLLPEDVYEKLQAGSFVTKKGSVLQTAILAGIMAAKKTSELIPLCHPLALNKCNVDIKMNDEDNSLTIICTVKVDGKTGVEMEALTGASVAALTIYDMCKAHSHDIVISQTRLLQKQGGKSDFNRAK